MKKVLIAIFILSAYFGLIHTVFAHSYTKSYYGQTLEYGWLSVNGNSSRCEALPNYSGTSGFPFAYHTSTSPCGSDQYNIPAFLYDLGIQLVGPAILFGYYSHKKSDKVRLAAQNNK
jgi:hypothetical protein